MLMIEYMSPSEMCSNCSLLQVEERGQVPFIKESGDCSPVFVIFCELNFYHLKISVLSLRDLVIWVTHDENRKKPFMQGAYLNASFYF